MRDALGYTAFPTRGYSAAPGRLSRLLLNVVAAALAFSYPAPALAQVQTQRPGNTVASGALIDDTGAGLLANIPSNIRGINSELLPETHEFAKLMELECHFGQPETSEEQIRLAAQKSGPLQSACLFPIIVNELQKRLDLIASGQFVLLPPDWNVYTLEAGDYGQVLFAPSSSSRLVTDYLLLREALRFSVLDIRQLILAQHSNKALPTYTFQLLRVDAAARSTTVAHRLLEASQFLTIDEAPPYMQRWQVLLRNAAAETISPYKSKLEALKEQVLDPRRKTIRNTRLSTIYSLSVKLDSLSQAQYNPTADLLRFVLKLPCSRRKIEETLEEYAELVQHQSAIDVHFSTADTENALKCVAAFRDLRELESTTVEGDGSDVEVALDSLPDLKAVIVKGQLELNTLLGSLQTFLATDTTSPF